MYDKNQTEVSKGALVELTLALGLYKNDTVLVGGWTPYFLCQNYFEHCGSIDIDLVLRPSIISRYESLRDIVLSLGYKPTNDIFRFRRELMALNGIPFKIDLDFLTEPEAKEQMKDFIEVQKGLQAVFIPNCSIVFNHNYLQTVKGVLPSGGEGSAEIKTSDIVGTLTMKGLALGRPRKMEKDSYDIYTVAGFHRGDPYKAAAIFKKLINEYDNSVRPQATEDALRKIQNGFASSNGYAALAVSRFMEEDKSTDASERVLAFISKI